MPYQSEAQRKFFHAKDKGITESEVNEFDKSSKGMKKVNEKSPLFKALGMKGK